MNLPKKSNLVLDHRYFLGSLRDFSGNNNSGVGTGISFQKKPDKHVMFSGTDKITVADSDELQLTEGTIIVYGDFDNTTTGRLVWKRSVTTNYDLAISSTSLSLYDGVGTSTGNVDVIGAKSAVVSFTVSGKPKFYKDGAFITDGNISSTVTVDSSDLIIGSTNLGNAPLTTPLKGVLIYNTVLTDEEIAQVHEWIMQTFTPSYPKKNFVYPSQITGKENGIIGAWDFKNVHGKIIDKTGNGNDGVVGGGITQSKINGLSALKFPGNAVIPLARPSAVTVAGTYSTSFLVKIYSSGVFHPLWHFADGSTDRNTCYIDNSERVRVGIYDGSYTGERSDSALNVGEVYHVVTTNNNKTIQLYVNGVLQSDSVNPSLSSTVNQLGGISTNFLNGDMAEFQVFDKALSQAEVTADYNKYAKLPYFLDDFLDYNESIANVTSGFLENSEWEIVTGTWKITRRTDQPRGHQIECIADGKLRYKGLVNADDMYTKEFELVSGTPTLTKNSTNIEIDAVATEKVGKVHLTFGA